MTERKTLYYNRDGVRRFTLTDDETPDVVRVYTEVEMDRVLKSIEEARAVDESRPRAMNRHLARVPMTVYEKSILERWTEEDWARWLNDPDNSAFRVHKGWVG